jgi:hypothetical protein
VYANITPDEIPRCICGAKAPTVNSLCHKCRARARWDRRVNGQRRRGERSSYAEKRVS